MLKLIFRWLFKKNGWRVNNPFMAECQHCVMIGAPHTSNWDFVYTMVAFEIMNIPLRFTIKKEWMRWPLSVFVKPFGAVAIDRTPEPGSPKKSMVDAMADLLRSTPNMAMVVTPEGTRKSVKKIRMGFYHVALKANVPIALGYLDYGKKIAGVGKMLYPSGDLQADMKVIIDFYKTVTAKFPELNSFCRPDFQVG
ncbi:MAG: 1-acyl-sn-glycerol-3-phosphate acyltransferase [Bacteroidota bacterium]